MYIPKILLCGDRAEFYARVGERPYKIVGQIEFVGEIAGQAFHFFRDGKFALDGKLYNYTELAKILRGGGADFIVFNKLADCSILIGVLQNIGCARSQIITLDQFTVLPLDNFYDADADITLFQALQLKSFKTLLDFDAHLNKNTLFTKVNNDYTEIDCISKGDILPIKRNIYSHIYKDFSECCFKHYDAALIDESGSIDFDSKFCMLEGTADIVIVLSRYNSNLEKHIRIILMNFTKVDALNVASGEWLFCYRRKPPEDFTMYVVTHKELPNEHINNLPTNYKIIHAGKALAQDFGYIGDNTGDNISHLNPYINEITALYWIWKNTTTTIVGMCHYRRFFTESNDTSFAYDKIITTEAALRLLSDCDILVLPYYDNFLQIENISLSWDETFAKFALNIIKKYLSKNQPEYIDALDLIMNSKHFYRCHIFITRRFVFNAYCKWLFSFYIDAFNEVIADIPLSQMQGGSKRLMGYFAERMLTVWLIKNNLRAKELNIIQVPNL